MLNQLYAYQSLETSCPKCKHSYIAGCVPHNNKFSICPCCSFPNPFNSDTRQEQYVHFHGGEGRYGSYPQCEDCNLYYDNYKYRLFEASALCRDYGYYGRSEPERFICGECMQIRWSIGSDICQEYYDGTGSPCKLIPVQSYPERWIHPEESLNPLFAKYRELETFCLSYLPETV
jgi:hypothetical protein